MSEVPLELFPLPDDTEVDVGQAAVRRYYQDIGKRAEMLKLSLAALAQDGHFVVGMNLKWPSEASAGFLMVVRALHPEGPVVAFHGGDQLLDTMLGVGGRIRAGQLEWRKDEYATEEWVDYLAWLHKRQIYM